ncbi:hypothetical protein Y1Q_0024246 [Alligator mississippiensis]|uniref:Uncharacterized protein n=1 Tax=Alligator mississippiensis TaxID=8496 RepID=A0A151NIE6_ALLMI|nr:hypothetical protein Y1Q_0024246 [Alligator mississippiensis]
MFTRHWTETTDSPEKLVHEAKTHGRILGHDKNLAYFYPASPSKERMGEVSPAPDLRVPTWQSTRFCYDTRSYSKRTELSSWHLIFGSGQC